MDLVSVIIPVYNVRDYLERCLKSVLSQTYENLEVIVVDNGSTDGSGEICDAFASEDSRVKVIHLENPDVSWARNAGLDSASGDWIMFVDSDDFIHRQAVELLLSAVGGENDIVMGDFRRVNDADVDVDEVTLEHDVASVQKRQYVHTSGWEQSALSCDMEQALSGKFVERPSFSDYLRN